MTKVYANPTTIIDKDFHIRSSTKIWHFVHIIKDAQIGEECIHLDYIHIGRGVKIGNTLKIENRVTVYEGVAIEDNVFVGPHVTFTNDL